MITSENALSRILRAARAMPPEIARLEDCGGRALAGPILAREDSPSFDNSMMDGFAVRSKDLRAASSVSPVPLRISGVSRAGQAGKKVLRRGSAIRVMTGAPLPQGADAVVMVEETRTDREGRVQVLHSPAPGEFIRKRGSDVRAGDLILKPGASIRPYEVALLAAQGFTRVPVIRRPKASIVVTGDEIVDSSQTPGPGKIRDANGPALSGALKGLGIAAPLRFKVKDRPSPMRKQFRAALGDSDLILLSGGVSVGHFDFTKAILKELGVREVFWRVAIKPGKPLFFGVKDDAAGKNRKLVFGLPGNPLSVLVCFEIFVRPALEKMLGLTRKLPSLPRGRTLNAYEKDPRKEHFLFSKVEPSPNGYDIEILKPQGSFRVGGACRSNALAISPIGVGRVRKGEELLFRWLR